MALRALFKPLRPPTVRSAWRSARAYGTRQESKPWRQKPNRKARLDVILTQDVHKLGVKGQIVPVKHGYGRNHLIPQKMAVYATHYNIEELNAFKMDKESSRVDEVEYLTKYLADKELTVRLPPGEPISITERMISKSFRQNLQMHVPLDCIELSEPISDPASDDNSVMIRLNEDTLVSVPVRLDLSRTKKEQRKLDKRKAFLARLAAKDSI